MAQSLQQIASILTAMLMSLQGAVSAVPASTQLAQVTPTASLSLSPSTASPTVNGTFTVSIVLNTGGQQAYGVDVNRLRFNPSILQVVDSDAGASGVQIAPGSLMALTIINSVDNTGGSVQFSQLANPGSTYSGSGTLATITFRAVATGSSNATFDFSLGSGTDSNVAGLGGDLLASVSGGAYTAGPALDTTAPSAPSNLSATSVTSTRVDMSWTASTDNVGVTGYRIERCSGSTTCSNFSQIGTSVGASYFDTPLTASTIYRYRVRAVDAAGNLSSYSSIITTTTQAPPDTTPPTISSVAVSSVTTSGATIGWTTNEQSDTQVDYGLTSSYGQSTSLNSSMVTSHSANLSGLSAATTYHFRAKSRDAAGNLSASSDGVLTTSSLPDTTAPSVPTGVTATSTSQSQIQISWNDSVDTAGSGQSVSGIGGYQVWRDNVRITNTGSTAYLDTGLSQGTTYSYQIAAFDAANNVSAKSTAVSVSIPLLSSSVQRKITLSLEGRPSNQRGVSGTLEFISPSTGAKVYQSSFTTDNAGVVTISVPAGLVPVVNLKPVIVGYLSKSISNVNLTDSSILEVSIPMQVAGDFNGDNLINSLDYSYMNGKWGSSDSLADLNRDGSVNSLDFAYVSNNWLKTGE